MSKYWNADDWHLYLSQVLDARANFPSGLNAVALKIVNSMEELRAAPIAELTQTEVDLIAPLASGHAPRQKDPKVMEFETSVDLSKATKSVASLYAMAGPAPTQPVSQLYAGVRRVLQIMKSANQTIGNGMMSIWDQDVKDIEDVADFLRDLPTSTDAAPRAQWQPIETATENECLLLGWWRAWPEREWTITADMAICTKGGWRHGQATHWMPLPAPPSVTSTAPQPGGLCPKCKRARCGCTFSSTESGEVLTVELLDKAILKAAERGLPTARLREKRAAFSSTECGAKS